MFFILTIGIASGLLAFAVFFFGKNHFRNQRRSVLQETSIRDAKTANQNDAA
jgi:hypothetical protein